MRTKGTFNANNVKECRERVKKAFKTLVSLKFMASEPMSVCAEILKNTILVNNLVPGLTEEDFDRYEKEVEKEF